MKIYCDGSGWNGSTSGYMVLTDTGIKEHGVFEEEFTNNEMEWAAMVAALELASPGDTIYADSQLVVKQLLGGWRIKEERLIPFAEEGKALLREKRVKVFWIPREQNLAGRALEGKN